MLHKITKMNGKGDETVLEYDSETVSTERLAEIEREFNEMMKKGYIPADLETNEIIKEFRPNTDILMIPRIQGGRA